jgi:RNA polymerase sigma factor (TIGR02999 family)
MADPTNVTHLLHMLMEDEEAVMDELFDRVYDELRTLAHRQLRRLRSGQTLNTTALVHEAYLKLVDQEEAEWKDRTHFFSVAAKAMRHIIINYARKKAAEKRGGGAEHVSFEDGRMAPQQSAQVLVSLDRALDRLTERDERMARVVELRFFGGMTQEESAAVLDVSTRTVRRDWQAAKAWLSKALSDASTNGSENGTNGSSPQSTE